MTGNANNLTRLFEMVAERLDAATEGTEEFEETLAQMEELAALGSVEAAETVAEIYCFSKSYHDAERAYRWYFQAFSARHYTTDFRDENDTPPHYCGPIGDFRNEAPVSSLVAEIGFERVCELDDELRRTSRATR